MRWLVTVWLLAMTPLASAETVLIMGDSISAAFGIDKAQGWVHLLDDQLSRECEGVSVRNSSVSGETTAGGLSRLPALLSQVKPSVVVIELGGNDGLRGTAPKVMQRNLESMIELSREAGAKVVLLGIHMPANLGEAYRTLFDNAYLQVVETTGVPFMPFILDGIFEHPGMMQEDGLHPTAIAQPRLLANAWTVMEKEIQPLCSASTAP